MRQVIPSAPTPDRALDEAVGVPLAHRFLPRPWGRQHVVEAGSADGPPVVLLHGWPQHWFAYRHVIAALAPTHRVIAIDTRGFGWSTQLHRPERADITSTALAHDVIATLDDLDLGAVHLVGHDWGGWFAFHVALGWPHRLASLTTLAIMPPRLDPRVVIRRAGRLGYLVPMAVAGGLVAGSPTMVELLLQISSSDRTTWDRDDGRRAMTTYAEQLLAAHPRTTTRRLYARMVRTELAQACRPEAAPLPAELRTEVWLGREEPIATEEMYASRWGDEVRTVTIPDAGHWPLDEAAPWVVDRLLPRLRSI